jgi:putative phosphoribosyl transferase
MLKRMRRFRDRSDAGKMLAELLSVYTERKNAVVLALPRGGVPVAYEVAMALRLPLEVFQVRKLGVPGHEELAMGAIGSGGGRYLNRDVIDALRIEESTIEKVALRERLELDRREKLYRDSRPLPDLQEKTIILVDDGIATGASVLAAVETLRSEGVAHVIVAVPVAPMDTVDRLRLTADEVVCLQMPEPFYSVGTWYQRFDQVGDDEVRMLLNDAAKRSNV